MGNPEKEPLCSPVALIGVSVSALQKLKKGLNTVTTTHLRGALCSRDWERIDLLGDNALFVARHKDDGISFVGAAALLMLIVQVIDITES